MSSMHWRLFFMVAALAAAGCIGAAPGSTTAGASIESVALGVVSPRTGQDVPIIVNVRNHAETPLVVTAQVAQRLGTGGHSVPWGEATQTVLSGEATPIRVLVCAPHPEKVTLAVSVFAHTSGGSQVAGVPFGAGPTVEVTFAGPADACRSTDIDGETAIRLENFRHDGPDPAVGERFLLNVDIVNSGYGGRLNLRVVSDGVDVAYDSTDVDRATGRMSGYPVWATITERGSHTLRIEVDPGQEDVPPVTVHVR